MYLSFLFYPREEPHCCPLKKPYNKYISALVTQMRRQLQPPSPSNGLKQPWHLLLTVPPECLSRCISPWDPWPLHPHHLLCSPSIWWLIWFAKFLLATLLGKSLTLCLSSKRLEVHTEVYYLLNTHSFSTSGLPPYPCSPPGALRRKQSMMFTTDVLLNFQDHD